MKIGKVTNIETTSLEMPYTKPLVTATNNFTVARGILVKVITEGGIEGYGYSDLFPRTGETPQTAQHVIDAVLKAKVVGKELEDLPRIRSEIDHVLTGNPRAKAALDSAMHDALARAYHMPLFVILGGKFRSEIRVIKMVSVGQPERETQNRVIGRLLQPGGPIRKAPLLVRLLDRFPLLHRIPGRLIGLGIRREHVRSPDAGLRRP